MSFGFGVGDFMVLANLAWNVYASLKDSSREFKYIACQVYALRELLNGIVYNLQEKQREQQPEPQLLNLATQCHDVLKSIKPLL
jgi:hypothetical protein